MRTSLVKYLGAINHHTSFLSSGQTSDHKAPQVFESQTFTTDPEFDDTSVRRVCEFSLPQKLAERPDSCSP
jgi:hypothetical protein